MLKTKKFNAGMLNFVKFGGSIIGLLAIIDVLCHWINFPHSCILAFIAWSVVALCYFWEFYRVLKINKKYPVSKKRIDARYYFYWGMGDLSMALCWLFYEQKSTACNFMCAILLFAVAFFMGTAVKHSAFLKKI